jgi:hypothetical protein
MTLAKREAVSFNAADKPLDTKMMTPIRAEVPRKGTPFKPQQQPVVSSPKSKKLPPLPHTELTVKSPHEDFGSEAECEPLGDPVAG